MKRSHLIITIVSFAAAAALLVGSVLVLRSCSTAPEYSEIDKPLRELVERSQKADEILFGKGLPVYERIYSPAARAVRYETGESYKAESGKEFPLAYLYYKVEGQAAVYAFKRTYETVFGYAFVSASALDGAGLEKLKTDFPLPSGEAQNEGFYSLLSSYEGKFAYSVPYEEPKQEFFYEGTDPEGYDYVRTDAEFTTVEAIRAYAATVYTPEYLASLESGIFGEYAELEDGEKELITKGRFYEDSRSDADYLLQTNKPEDVLFTENCVYDFSTARVIKRGSNSSSVKVSISYHFPSNPSVKKEAILQMKLVGSTWYLASSTFAAK